MVISASSLLSWVIPIRVARLVRACINESSLARSLSSEDHTGGFSKRKLGVLMVAGEGLDGGPAKQIVAHVHSVRCASPCL